MRLLRVAFFFCPKTNPKNAREKEQRHLTHRTVGKEKPEKRAAKAGGRRERSEREVARRFYRFLNSKQKNEFLNIYIETGTIGRAAKASGITRQTHYNWLKEDAAYKKAFGEAKEMAGDLLEEEAYRRAVDGTEMCVYYKGKKVDSYRKMSDALLILLLKGAKPDVYAERQDTKITGEITLNAAQALKEARERIKNAADRPAGND